jgi:AsmA-like protein
MTLRKKILLWSIGATGLVLILLAVSFFLTPLYVNTPAIKGKIQDAVSRGLGGKITYEKMDLTLFPRPRVVIHRVTLSVPGTITGAFSSVNVSLQQLPLMRGNVLVSKIRVEEPQINLILPRVAEAEKAGSESPAQTRTDVRSMLHSLESFGPGLDIEIEKGGLAVIRDRRHILTLRNITARFTAPPGEQGFTFRAVMQEWGLLSLKGSYHIDEEMVGLSDVSAALGHITLSGISARLLFSKPPHLEVLGGRARLSLSELRQLLSSFKIYTPFLKNVKSIEGMVDVSTLQISGPLFRPAAWETAFAGSVERVFLDMPLFPGTLAVSRGEFSVAQDSVSLRGARVSMLDTAASLSGVLRGLRGGIRSAELSLRGTMGSDSLAWAYTKAALSHELMISGPLIFSDVRLRWRKKAGISLSGAVVSSKGAALSFDGFLKPPGFTIRRAIITDVDTNASFTMRRSGKSLDLSFTGRLAGPTLDKIFEQKTFGRGVIRGDFNATIILDHPLKFTGRGRLAGEDIVMPWGLSIPVKVDGMVLEGDGGSIFTVTSTTATWGSGHYSAAGTVTASEDGFVLDLDVTADRIDVGEIRQALAKPERAKESPAGPEGTRRRSPVVLGVVYIKTQSLIYDRYAFSPVVANVSLAPDEVHMAFSRAETCGISLPGTLTISRREVSFEFKPAAAGQRLESSLDCLAGKDLQLTGEFDLTADMRARGNSGALLSLLEGNVDFKATKGKIYRYPLLAKIFSVLSFTEIFRGKTPELGGSGFPYRSLTVKGEIHHGTFQLEQAYLSGSSFDLIADGEVDLTAKKINLTVLVAPFSTMNWVIRHIPLIGKVMGGTLISVPIKVSGDLADPEVIFLAPSAVGKRLVTILQNILNIPVELISPILPREKKKRD